MQMPNGSAALVPEAKLSDYLLNPLHPVGGPKARFFESHGFTPEHRAALEAALLRLAGEEDATAETTPFGTKYLVEGDVLTPTGRTIRLRTVWIVEPSEPRPRLVTAYPA